MSVAALFSITLPQNGDEKGAVSIPEDPVHWAKELQESVDDGEGISLVVDTLAMGLGGCVIGFRPGMSQADVSSPVCEKKTIFGFLVNKKTLIEIRDALDFAIKHYND